MGMRSLKCPSCGADLTLPSTLEVAHCMYCGNRLVLESTEAVTDRQQVARYERLAEVALEARDFSDLSQYAEKILELDTDSPSGWIYKAHVNFAEAFLGIDSAEQEAKQYLRIAAKVAPDDVRITQALEIWGRVMAVRQADAITEHLAQGRRALRDQEMSEVREHAVQAVESAMKTLQYAEDEEQAIDLLEGISGIVSRTTGISWASAVQHQLAGLRAIQSKRAMQQKVQDLQAVRLGQQTKLDQLKGKTGFFVGRRIKQAEKSLVELDREIESAQKAIAEQESIINQAKAEWGSFYSLAP